jgi:hypothetical protein
VAGQYAFWNGWLGGLPDPASLFAPADQPLAASAETPTAADRFVVYLDGIHQSTEEHPPRVAALLAELRAQLPAGTELIEGVQTYTISPAELAADAGSRWFWRRLFALQESHPNPLVNWTCGALVQANNVIKVGISADRRYGPILNYELALKVAQRLVEAGLRRGSGQRIVLLGYSGGGEMAMAMADVLQVLCRCPVQIVTCCGVFSGNQRLDQVAGIAMVVGSRDPVAALGREADGDGPGHGTVLLEVAQPAAFGPWAVPVGRRGGGCGAYPPERRPRGRQRPARGRGVAPLAPQPHGSQGGRRAR